MDAATPSNASPQKPTIRPPSGLAPPHSPRSGVTNYGGGYLTTFSVSPSKRNNPTPAQSSSYPLPAQSQPQSGPNSQHANHVFGTQQGVPMVQHMPPPSRAERMRPQTSITTTTSPRHSLGSPLPAFTSYNTFDATPSPSRRSSRARTPRKHAPGSEEDESYRLAQAKTVIAKLRSHKSAPAFNEPVDPVELGIPDYFNVVKNPMDLGTISTKLHEGRYANVQELCADVQLVWDNCLLYNPPEDYVSKMAHAAKKEFEKLCKQYKIHGEEKEDDEEYQERRTPIRAAKQYADQWEDDEDDYTPAGKAKSRVSARLSAKGGTPKKYYDDSEEDDADDSNDDDSDDEDRRKTRESKKPAGPIVAKIIAQRKKQDEQDTPIDDATEKLKHKQSSLAVSKEEGVEYEYFVRWKDMSYLHAEWVSGARIEQEGTQGRGKIARFWKARQEAAAQNRLFELDNDGLFPPEYCEVDRIIAEKEEIERCDETEELSTTQTSKPEPKIEPSVLDNGVTEMKIEAVPDAQSDIKSEEVEIKSENGVPSPSLESDINNHEAEKKHDRPKRSKQKKNAENEDDEEWRAEAEDDDEEDYDDDIEEDEPRSRRKSHNSTVSVSSFTSPLFAPSESISMPSDSDSFMSMPFTYLPTPVPVQLSGAATIASPPIASTTPARVATSKQPSPPATPKQRAAPREVPAFAEPLLAGNAQTAESARSPQATKPWQHSPGYSHAPLPRNFADKATTVASKPIHLLKPGQKLVKYYLVKWCELPYTDCTWEKASFIKDDKKIEEFRRINSATNKRSEPRPSAADFKPITDLVFKDNNKLRSYQVEGLNWLVYCWFNRRSCILADEMGLGKTAQSVSFVDYLYRYQAQRGPFLVVVPLSTLSHWEREFAAWTHLNVVVYQGNQANRQLIRQYEWYQADRVQRGLQEPGRVKRGPKAKMSAFEERESPYKFDVLLTTYEMILRSDWNELSAISWKALVVDEAHRLKNRDSKLLEHLRTFRIEHRLILTGTPLQNNTEELWTLLNFIEPHLFASLADFMQHFGNLKDAEQVARLHSVLRPHLLRRLKEDVENSIPPKEEIVVEMELTSLQKKYYRAILERNRDFLNKGCSAANVPNLINVVMQLRKVCNHPYLIDGVEDKEVGHITHETEAYLHAFIQSTGKLALLDKLLPKLKAGGHKVLIFSQMVRVLDMLETYLSLRGHIYERIDGGVRGNERQAAIDRYNKPGSNRFVFLLCTRAGGLGINLASADTVVIYDSDWNPQNDVQAQARCHRIGQTKEVKVYRLITRNTYERHMFERTSKKLGLDQAVLDNMTALSETGKESKGAPKDIEERKKIGKEIDNLLRYGAYDLFRDEEEGAPKDLFGEDDIDKILARDSKLIRYDNAPKTTDDTERRSSTFSKAVFRSSEADADIDVNADNFWEMVLPDAKDAASLLQRLREGKFLQSPEKLSQFWHDLTHTMDECLDQWQKRVDMPKEAHPLIAVCEGILEDTSRFSSEQVEDAMRWSSELTKPRKRRRTSTHLDLGRSRRTRGQGEPQGRDDESYIGASDDSDSETRKGQKRRRSSRFSKDDLHTPKKRRTVIEWNMTERKRVQEGVLAFGRPCWKEMQHKGLERRSLAEIRTYALAFLSQCMRHASNVDDREIFEEALNFFKLNGHKYSGKGGILASNVPDDEEDTFSDSEEGPIEESTPKRGKKLPKRKGRSSLGAGPAVDPTLSDPQYVTNIKRKSKSWTKRLSLLKRIRLEMERFPNVNDFTLPAGWNAGRKQNPTPHWWGSQEDRDILVGTFKHGFACYDAIYADETLCFKSRRASDSVSANEAEGTLDDQEEDVRTVNKKDKGKASKYHAKESDNEEEEDNPEEEKIPGKLWPAKRVLNLRIKVLIDKVDKLRRAEEKLKEREERNKQREEQKRSKQDKMEKEREERLNKRKQKQEEKNIKNQERQREWAKRERQDARIAIMAYGPQDWNVIKDKARLANKTPESIQAFYLEMLSYAQQMVKDFPNPYSNMKGKKKRRGPEVFTEGEKEEPEEELDAEDEKVIDEYDSDASETEDTSATGKTSENNRFMLSPIIAHRLVERVNLWDTLRNQVLCHPQLQERMQHPNVGKLPSWWVAGEFDLALLRGVDQYGIGNMDKEWTTYLEENDCEFFPEGTTEQRGARKQKQAFLLHFIEDKSPLIERLRYYCELVLQPHSEQPTGGRKLARRRSQTSASSVRADTTNRGRKRRRVEEISPTRKPVEKGSYANTKIESMIPRDKQGNVILPLMIKGISIHELGEIVWDRPGFFTKVYLWPVGFRSTRRMASINNPNKMVTYTSEILDDGGDAPVFQVTAEDMPGTIFRYSTPSGVWAEVLKRIKRKSSVSVSGPEMFGYSDPIVKKLFQELPNADKCTGYQARDYGPPSTTARDPADDAEVEQDEFEAEEYSDEGEEDSQETALGEADDGSAIIAKMKQKLKEAQGEMDEETLQKLQKEVEEEEAKLRAQLFDEDSLSEIDAANANGDLGDDMEDEPSESEISEDADAEP